MGDFRKRVRVAALGCAVACALLARPTFAANDIWSGSANGNWATSGNWSGGVPGSTDTAEFGSSAQTTITIPTTAFPFLQVGTLQFDSGAPQYTFDFAPTSSDATLSILGIGIVDNSSHAPIFNLTGVDNGGGGILPAELDFGDFNNHSGTDAPTAGDAIINTFDIGVVNFYEHATAGTAQITIDSSDLSGANFADSSSADHATIVQGVGITTGSVDFSNSATAANATINLANVWLFDSATLGSANVTVSTSILFNNNSNGGNATVTASSGSAVDFSASSGPNSDNKVSVGSLAGAGNVYLGADELTVGSANTSTTLSGVISDCGNGTACQNHTTGGSLVKTGSGTLLLSGQNTYTGATTINGGTLQVGTGAHGSGQIQSTGAITVGNGTDAATLSGNGYISATTVTVNNNATLRPGLPGTGGLLEIDSAAVTFQSGATFESVFDTGSNGQLYAHTASLNGATLVLDVVGGSYSIGSSYSLASISGGYTGTFGTIIGADGFDPSIRATVVYNAGEIRLRMDAAPTFIWTGGTSSDWNDPTNWTDTLPTNIDTASFQTSSQTSLDINEGTSVGGISYASGGNAFVINVNSQPSLADVDLTIGSAGLVNASNQLQTIHLNGDASGAHTASLILDGGTISDANGENLAVVLSPAHAIVDISGASGAVTIGSLGAPSFGTSNLIHLGANTLKLGAFGNNDLLYATIDGTGGITKQGTGTLSLGFNFVDTYSGATQVQAGTLNVSANITASSGVEVLSGGTIAGIGNLPVTVIRSGGTVASGNAANGISTGTLTIAGNLTMESTANLMTALSSSTTSLLTVNGLATLGGTAVFVPDGFGFTQGTQYTILTATGGLSGTFSGVSITNNFFTTGHRLVPRLSYVGNDVIATLDLPNFTWKSAPGGNNWNTDANWVDNIAPGSDDTVVFATSTVTTIVVPSSTGVTGMTFNSGASAYSFLIGDSGTPFSSMNIFDSIVNNSSNAPHFVLNSDGSGAQGGIIAFQNSASAANAVITDLGGNGLVQFGTNASAGTANIDVANVEFLNGTTANAATITIEKAGDFFSSANGATANITVASTGSLVFHDGASLGTAATLTNRGTTTFGDSSHPGDNTQANQPNTSIDNFGTLSFQSAPVASNVAIQNESSGQINVEATSLPIGSLSGSGTVTLGIASTSNATLSLGLRDSTFSGTIQDATNQQGNLTKTGFGVFTLNGTNTYSGTTSVTGGTLRAGAANAFSPNSTVSLFGTTLDLNGFAQSIGALSGSGGVTLNGASNSLALTAGGNNASTTYNGTITGTGSFTKAGTGTLILTSNSNTYTGSTTISAGTLQLGNGGSTGMRSGVFVDNGTLAFNFAPISGGEGNPPLVSSYDFTGTVSGSGGVTIGGSAPINWKGAAIYSGQTTLSGTNLVAGGTNLFSANSTYSIGASKTLDLANFDEAIGGLSGSGFVTLGTGTLTVGGNDTDTTYLGVISGTGALIKTGAGTLTLSNATNSYSGGTTVTDGTLSIGADHDLGNPLGGITLGGDSTTGTLEFSTGFNLASTRAFTLGAGGGVISILNSDVTDISQDVSGAGGLEKAGSGTVVLLGHGSFNGGTTVSQGELDLGDASHTASLVGAIAVDDSLFVEYADLSQVTTITNNNLVTFDNTSSAASVTINNATGSETDFQLTTSAAQATITNDDFATTSFFSNSTAGSATITNTGTGVIQFGGNSDAGTAHLINTDQAVGGFWGVFFEDSSSAANAVIDDGAKGIVEFDSDSTAANATININDHGRLGFFENATAGDATITLDGLDAEADFFDNSTGGNARLILSNNALVDFSSTFGPNDDGQISIGSIEGLGDIIIGDGNTLTVGSNNLSTTFSGVISDTCGCFPGVGALVKTGTGTLTLSGTNNYSGGTTILQGRITVTADANLGDPNGPLTLDGGQLRFGASFDLASTRTITLGAAGGTINTAGSDTTITQTIGGSGALTKTGAGTLTLSNNTFGYAGPTHVNSGTLQLTNATITGASVDVEGLGTLAAGGASEIAGPVTIGSGGTLAVFTPGDTLLLDSTLTVDTGGAINLVTDASQSSQLSVQGDATLGGEFHVDPGPGGGYSAGQHFTLLTAGASLDDSSATFIFDGSFGVGITPRITTTATEITLDLDQTPFVWAASPPATANWNDPASWENGLIPGASDTATFDQSSNPNPRITDDGESIGTMTFVAGVPAYTVTVSAVTTNTSLNLTGAGVVDSASNAPTFDLNGAPAHTASLIFSHSATAGDATILLTGLSELDFSDTSSAGHAVIAAADGAGASIRFLGTADASQARIDLGTTGSLHIEQSSAGVSIGSLTGSIGSDLVVVGANTLTVGTLGLDDVYGGVIYDPFNQGGSLVKTGSGTLTLTGGVSLRLGVNTIDAGILQVGDGSGAGYFAGSVLINSGATLALDRPSLSSLELTDISGAGALHIIAGTITLTTDNPNHTGTTTIDQGATLQLGDGGINSSDGMIGSHSIVDNGALIFDRPSGSQFFFDGVISGNGSVEQQGAGFIVVRSDNTYTGATTIDAGAAMYLGDGTPTGSTGSITSDVTDNGLLVFQRGDRYTFNNAITGTGDVQVGVSGSGGLITLTHATSYSGETTIEGGATLFAGAANVFSPNSDFGLCSCSVLGTNGFDETIAGLHGGGNVILTSHETLTIGAAATSSFDGSILGVGNIVLTGSNGAHAFSNRSTFVGTTTIDDTTLILIDNATPGTYGTVDSDIVLANNGALDLQISGGTSLAGSISGTGFLHKEGDANAVTIIHGTSTYSGDTLISGGTLRAGRAGAFSAASDYDVQSQGTLSAFGFNQTLGGLNGSGTLALGGGTVSVGALGLDETFAGVVSDAGSLVKVGGGNLVLSGSGTDTFVGPTIVSAGRLSVNGDFSHSSVSVSNGATLGGIGHVGTTTVQSGGTLAPGNSIGTINVSGDLTLASGSDFAVEFSPTAADEAIVSGDVSLAGILDLIAASGSYSPGQFTILTGRAVTGQFSAVNAPNLAGLTVTMHYDPTDVTVVLTKTGVQWAANPISSDWNTGANWDGGSVPPPDELALFAATSNATVNVNQADAALGLSFDATAPAYTINVAGTAAGDASLTVGASGIADASSNKPTLTASGAGGHTGTLTFTGASTADAILTANAGGAIAFTAAVDASASRVIVNGGSFDLTAANSNETFGALEGTGGTVALGSNSLTVGGLNTSTAFSGAITGSGGLTKTGTGTLALAGANSYSGGTTIGSGTLQIGNGGASGTLAGAVNDNSVLAFNRTDTLTIAGAISGTGSVQQIGTGTTVLTANNTYGGGTTITAGTLQLGNGGTSGAIQGAVNDNGILAFNRTDALTFAGLISGTGGLRQAGTGTVILTADNTFGGVTTVAAGTLQLGNGGTTGSVAGAITDNATLAVNHSGTFTLANAVSGTGAFVQAGAGTTVMTALNTYGGGTTIGAGTLQLGNGGASGSFTGNVTDNGVLAINRSDVITFGPAAGVGSPNSFFGGAISGSGAFVQMGGGTTILTAENTYTGGTTITAGTLQIGEGHAFGSIAGNVVDNSHLIFDRSDDATFTGTISGTGTLTKRDANTLTLTADNTLSGTTTISAGTLQLGNGGTTGTVAGAIVDNGTLAVNRSNNVTLAGAISGSGGLNKLGAGTLTLTGADTYAGATDVQAGTLQVDGTIASAVTVENGAVLAGTGTVGAADVTKGGTLAAGDSGVGALHVTGGLTLETGSHTVADVGPTAADSVTVGGAAAIAGDLTLVGSGGTFAAGQYSLIASVGTLSGTFDALNVTGSFGGFDVDLKYDAHDVILVLDQNGVRWKANPVSGDWNTGANWLIGTVPSATDKAYFGASTITTVNINQATAIAGINLAAGAPAYTFNVAATASADSALTVSGTGVGDGSSNRPTFIVAGSGSHVATLTFAGSNSADAVLTANSGGTVSFTGAASGGTSQAIVNAGGALTIAGLTNGGMTIGSIEGAGSIVLGGNTLTEGGLGTSTTFSGTLSGSGGLTKVGAGTLTLTGANTYTGVTTVSAGTVQVGAGGTTGAIAGDVADNASLVFSRSDALAFGGAISGTGAVTQAGTGTTTLTATNTYTGGTSIAAGTLQIGNGGATGSIVGNVADNGALVINRSGTLTLAGIISGTGVLTQAGSGTTVLTGANTYSGTTTIGAGTLQVGAGGTAGTLGTGAVVDNAVLVFNRSDALSFAGAISGTGGLNQAGTGTTTLSGAGTYSGATGVTVGTLRAGATNVFSVASSYAVASILDPNSFNQAIGSLSGAGSVTLGSAALTTGGDNFSTVFSGVISGSGGLTKAGSGTFTLTGANTYSGGTTVAGGTVGSSRVDLQACKLEYSIVSPK